MTTAPARPYPDVEPDLVEPDRFDVTRPPRRRRDLPARLDRGRRQLSAILSTPIATTGLLIGLMAGSTAIRLNGLGDWLWIDEGISVGISSHPVASLPRILRRDGSPPLYYLILHGWIRLFGTSEVALHALSLVFAIAVIPVSFWLARRLFGLAAGWITAVLAATNTYLTTYGHEVRMYTLLVLLSTVACGCFLQAFVFRRRAYLPWFALSLVATLYTHNWGLFLGMGFAVAGGLCWLKAPDRPAVLRDGVLAFGAVGLLYLPWLPTLVYQARHTGAPWSETPVAREAISAVGQVLGDERALVALVLTAGVALVGLVVQHRHREALASGALLAIILVTLATAWVSAQINPAWQTRYYGIFLPALILAGGLGLARDRVARGPGPRPHRVVLDPSPRVPDRPAGNRGTRLEVRGQTDRGRARHPPRRPHHLGPDGNRAGALPLPARRACATRRRWGRWSTPAPPTGERPRPAWPPPRRPRT